MRELRDHRTVRDVARTARDLVLEFGPAELADSLVVRPVALTAGLAWIGPPALGALVGKLTADFLFYLPTITSYELLRRARAREE